MDVTLFDMSDAAVWNRSCSWINTMADPALKTILGPMTRLSHAAALAIIRTNDSFDDALAAADASAVKSCVTKLVEVESYANGVDLALYPEHDQEKLERIICWLVDCAKDV
jgi:hypothetical protein